MQHARQNRETGCESELDFVRYFFGFARVFLVPFYTQIFIRLGIHEMLHSIGVVVLNSFAPAIID